MSRETWLKVGLWLIPIIFAAGSLYYQQTQLSAQAHETEDRVELHVAQPAHPVIQSRVDVLERDTREMVMEQRAIRTEQSRAAENISAICQATNAHCR
jgi:hypothetical protein